MYADEIRRRAEEAPQAALPAIATALWRAFGDGQITEAEAEVLSGLIEARQSRGVQDYRMPLQAAEQPQDGARQIGTVLPRRAGSRPRTDASMERRRRWAASGRLPPQLAAQFTLAEQAALAVVAVETVKRGDCRLYHEQIAALAGVSRSTVRATLRRAKDLGIITIEERRSSAWRNLSSVVRIVGRDWIAWNRLVRRSVGQGGGAISPTTTSTKVSNPGKTRTATPSRGRLAAQNPPRRTTSQAAGA